jgi:teichuronic acid exporter
MPLQQVTTVVATVLFPTFSRLAPNEIAREYHRAVGGILAIFIPVVLSMGFVAEDAVVLVLGARWIDSAVFLQVLAPTLLWRSASELLRSVYNAQGRTDLTLMTTVWGQLLTLVCIAIGCAFGPLGVALGVLAGTASGTILEQGVAFRSVGLPWRPLIRAFRELLPPTVVAAVLAFVTFRNVPEGWPRLLFTTTNIFAGFLVAGWVFRAQPFAVFPGPLGARAKRAA